MRNAASTRSIAAVLSLALLLAACGGGDDDGGRPSGATPTSTPTVEVTPTDTPEPTTTASASPTATDPPAPSPTATPSATGAETGTPTATATPTTTTGVECDPPACVEILPGPEAQDDLLTALLEAESGHVILIREGTYDFSEQLSLRVDDVTIRGEGMDRTISRFSGQTTRRAEPAGPAPTTSRSRTSPSSGRAGDLVKVLGADGVTFRRVRTEWTNGPDTNNGAYGLYPVQCRNVLIEDSRRDRRLRRRHLRRPVAQHHRARQPRRVQRRRDRDRELDRCRRLRQRRDATTPAASWSSTSPACRSRTAGARASSTTSSTTNNTPNFGRPGQQRRRVPDGTGADGARQRRGRGLRQHLPRQRHLAHPDHRLQRRRSSSAAPSQRSRSTTATRRPSSSTTTPTRAAATRSRPDAADFLATLNGGAAAAEHHHRRRRGSGQAGRGRAAGRAAPVRPGGRRDVPEPRLAHDFANLEQGSRAAQLRARSASADRHRRRRLREIEITPGPKRRSELLTALLEAEPGDVILLKEGRYDLTEQLSLDRRRRDASAAKASIRPFSPSPVRRPAGEGLLVQRRTTSPSRTSAFEDAPGDQFKVHRRRRRDASGACARSGPAGPTTDNGAYGLYPVECNDVLIEDSVVDRRLRRRHLRRPVAQHHRAPQPRRAQRGRDRDRELDRRRRPRQHRDQQHRRHPGVQPARPAGAGRPAHARLRQRDLREQHDELRAAGQHRRRLPAAPAC